MSSQSQSNDPMQICWQEFMTAGKISEKVRPVILKSWQRCREYGVNPLEGIGRDILNKESLNNWMEENSQMIEIARPYMQTIFLSVEGSGYMVVLTDKSGRILFNCGDPDTLGKATGVIQFVQGANWSEEAVGTNAIGTALALQKAIQISGAEHFCQTHHLWTCSAAPIHNPDGEIIGCIDISGPIHSVNLHTFGMIVAAVEAIENQLRKDRIQEEKSRALELLSALTESVTEGLLAVDHEEKILLINPSACSILGLKEQEVRGEKLATVLGPQNHFSELVLSSLSKTDLELVFDHSGERIHCTCTSRPMIKEEGQVAGVVFTLREIQKVHRLVNRIVGATARFTCQDIVGESEEIKRATKLVLVAAKSRSNVLLLGESGTGKELFAQAIHNHSHRQKGPFVAVNCAALPRELVQSELFGYSEGAFTGAKRGGNPGKFELANGGTLFLDEIGDMPMELQVNLLRVLQERRIVRVGGEKVIPIDVRIIAATNKDLTKAVSDGCFREELYYRLNVLSIFIPPLRARGRDIELLTLHLIQMFAHQLGKAVKGASPEFMNALSRYLWPGNVRELQNVLEYAINVTEQEYLSPRDLPRTVLPRDVKPRQMSQPPKIHSLGELEKEALEKALILYQGNITKTAKALGIGRNTLYGKMRKLGVEYT